MYIYIIPALSHLQACTSANPSNPIPGLESVQIPITVPMSPVPNPPHWLVSLKIRQTVVIRCKT